MFQMSKIWTLQRNVQRTQVCDKCGKHDPDHMENECNNIKCANCHEEHPAFSRSCAIYKKEKVIMFIKHIKIYLSLKQGKSLKAIWEPKHTLM